MPLDRLWVRVTTEELEIERRQAIDEGKAFDRIRSEYDRLRETLEADPLDHQEAARAFLDRSADLPIREGYEFEEPSGLGGIRSTLPESGVSGDWELPAEELHERIHGAWQGRAAGCLLGKPFETWTRERIHGFLNAIDAYPLREYVRSDVPDDVAEEYDLGSIDDYKRAFVNEVDHMPRDDDLDYTIAGLGIVDTHGLAFEPEDVAGYWLANIPAYNTFTAERVAYRNFLNLIQPPESASHRNPYREGIGALIRADFYGYVAAGDPERAAEMAWRDARISHVKNGIYGEMWVAAMLAAAPALDDPSEVVRAGLSQVPAESRFAAAIEDVLGWYEEGVSHEQALDRIHDRWDESSFYEWLHTISNAQIIAIGLLWGDGEYGRSVSLAVQAGFDTDCTGATVGSVFGMLHGADAIPERWTNPLNDTVETALVEFPRKRISELAERTVELSKGWDGE